MYSPTRRPVASDDDRRALAEWAASGAMAITGRADGPPLGPPAGLVEGLQRSAAVIRERSALLGVPLEIDAVALLGERAAIGGLTRRSPTSCGGATRLVRAADGWLAVALPRRDDRELLPAWLGIEAGDAGGPEPPWAAVEAALDGRRAHEAAEQAWLLGLPVSQLPEGPGPTATAPPPLAPLPVRATPVPGPAFEPRSLGHMTVIDLSSLWAGPLCGNLLSLAGADVVKVESNARPDGSRAGPPRFFDVLNAGKRSVALDLAGAGGWRVLRRLLAAADVVIEGSRPRALEQRGIEARELVADAGPRVWVSITGHGRTGAGRNRVAFGDDAAVAGGLVVADQAGPCFCADAAADPVAGLVAAAACLDALAVGGRWLVDVAMVGVAASLAGPTLGPDPDRPGNGPAADVAPPRARSATGPGPAIGEHTAEVLHGLGVTP
jgi:crotonobetainyl-CoA:carnitine CoA-transferase CaiB-like acyl-CoA transferase